MKALLSILAFLCFAVMYAIAIVARRPEQTERVHRR